VSEPLELGAREISTGDATAGRPRLSSLGRPRLTFAGRNRSKADVRVYRVDGIDVAVKDYGPRPWWIRHTLGRFLISREAHAYRVAGAVEGLPEFYGRRGPWTLATRYVEARPLPSGVLGVDPAVLDRVERIVAALHARGIAIGDLHRRNVLLDDAGAVHLIDLATAWAAGPGSGRFRRWMFDRLRDADLVALARLRARATGNDPDHAVASVGAAASRWDRRMRRVKQLRDRLRGR